jgi:hypothetical protein
MMKISRSGTRLQLSQRCNYLNPRLERFPKLALFGPPRPAGSAANPLDSTDPLMIEVNTSTEYWQKGASLIHTDPAGRRDAEPKLKPVRPHFPSAAWRMGRPSGGGCGPADTGA